MSYQARQNRQFRHNRNQIMHISLTAIIALVIILFVGLQVSASFISGTATGCVITAKDRTTGTDGKSDQRIYAENCNNSDDVTVFKVSDNLPSGHFSSAKTYAGIEIGKTYNVELRGLRIPILSMFENAIKVTPSE